MKYSYFGFYWPDFDKIHTRLLIKMRASHIYHEINQNMIMTEFDLYNGYG